MDYTICGILQARILEWVAIPFSRGIFPTQGWNLGLPHYKWILYQLSHQGSPNEDVKTITNSSLEIFYSQVSNILFFLFFVFPAHPPHRSSPAPKYCFSNSDVVFTTLLQAFICFETGPAAHSRNLV